MGSIFIYVAVFALSALIVQFGYKRKSKIIQGLGLLMPILLGGLRYDVGLDYMSYFNAYADIVSPQVTLRYDGTPGLEGTFHVIAHISHFLTSSPVVLFLIYSLITVLAFYAALRLMQPKSVGYALFFFYSIFYLNSFNIMRQGAAMSIGALAITHYVNGSRRKAIMYVVLASLFHFSALLIFGYMALTCIMEKSYLNKRKMTQFSRIFFRYLIVSVAIITLGFGVAAVGQYIYNVTGRVGVFDANVSSGVIFKYLLTISVMFVSIYAWRYFSQAQKRLSLFIALGLVVYSLGIVHNEAARLGMYLLVLLPIYASLIYDFLPTAQLKGKIFISMGITTLCLLYIASVHISNDEGVKYDYQSIIMQDDYNQEIKRIQMQ